MTMTRKVPDRTGGQLAMTLPVGIFSILSNTSRPSITWAKMVYLPAGTQDMFDHAVLHPAFILHHDR